MSFLKLFSRLILRPLRQERLRTSLIVLAVALGVAAVLAIELAGEAAAGSFRSSMETLTGNASFEVTSTGGVPVEILTRLAELPYPLTVHPRIEDYAVISPSGKTVPVIGIDLLSESISGIVQNPDEGQQAGDERSIWVSKGLGHAKGETLRLLINDSSETFKVIGVIGEANTSAAIVMDIGMAARALRRGNRIDRILVDVPQNKPLEQWRSILQAALPPGTEIAPQGTQTEENRRMLEGFRWNLRVLSYVALAVGAFLIYNTISVSVVRRRFEIGILRALGATRVAILAAFLSEAIALGFAGALAGMVLGRAMAAGAVGLVAATVQSLYVTSSPAPLTLTWASGTLALAIGLIVSFVSALAPAWEASQVAPVEAMARGRREHMAHTQRWRSLLIAAGLAVAAWLASRQPAVHGKPVYGYLAAILLIGASALTIPVLVSLLRLLPIGHNHAPAGVEGLLATRSLAGSLLRTAVLVGALSTAVAVLVAVGIMVGSFRETVVVWLNDQLQADLYVSPAVPPGADRHPSMSSDIPIRIAALPEVAAVDQIRSYEIRYQGLPATLGGIDARVAGRFQHRNFFSGRSASSQFAQLVGQNTVIVSEPFANKHGVRSGDVLRLDIGGKQGEFRVIDIYYDYSSERGLIIMDRGTLFNYLPDSSPSNLAVYLKPGVLLETGRDAVQAAVANRRVLVALNRALREGGMKVFDRTFAITYALEAIAVFVAVTGVGGALLALVLDRRREFALLRFLGAADLQVRRIIFFEAGLLGLLANCVGVVLGFFLSLLLIYVINKQSFGWTIQFHWPVGVLLAGLSIVYAATLLAAFYPARIVTRLIPVEVIHEE